MAVKKQEQRDILEILREAEEQNIAAERVSREERVPELEKTIVADEHVAKRTPTKVTKRINAETAELIDKYSTRVVEPKMTDTQKLRERLAKHNEGDDLLGYIADDNAPKKPGKKVEKLYKMISDAKTKTLSDAEKQPPAEFVTERFSDEIEVPKYEEYQQEQMFPMGDTIPLGEDAEEISETASYDEEYESLTERVTESELGFESNDENEGQVKFITDDDKLEVIGGADRDETDISLRVAFDMMDDDDGDFDRKLKEANNKAKSVKNTGDETLLKYISRDQNAEIAGYLRKKIRRNFVKTIIVAVLMLGILFLEIATADSGIHGDFAKQGRYGILYILIDLQLLFFIGITLVDSLRNGIKGIFSFRLTTDSLLAVSIFFATAYSVVLLFIDPQAEGLRLYNLPAAFGAFCSVLMSYLTAKKDYRCFRLLASKRPKYTACELDGSAKEADEFYKYLFDDSDIYTVKKAGFVDGFIERIERRARAEEILNFILPVILIAGAILFVVMTALGQTVVASYSAFSILVAASVPASAFFMVALPAVSANRIGRKHGTAFIGNAVSEEYSSASVLSFADTEVYPANLVKITNIRLYGENRIDSVITDLARLFSFVGGPLSKVLASTLSEKVDKPSMIRVIESASDGLCVAMEGRNYFIGKRSYLARYRFEAPKDNGDDEYERGSNSIMYVVCDEKLAAKVYIRYKINPLFDALLRDLYKAGLCLGIKTLDPNISNELIAKGITFRKCPVSVLKSMSSDEVMGEVERADSGIVCASTLHNFLKMFALCDKARHITKSNAIISVVSVFLSFATVAFLAIVGDVGAITSLHAVAFQLFWLLPVWLVTFLLM